MSRGTRHTKPGFFRQHSLSLIVAAVLAFLFLMYQRSDASTHLGTFYGNAVADWLGMLVFIIATKYFFEIGSRESRRPHPKFHMRLARFVVQHSLTIVLALTGAAWVAGYARSDVKSKSGEVLGNIVSEWTQVLGLVLITKFARETKSKEA